MVAGRFGCWALASALLGAIPIALSAQPDATRISAVRCDMNTRIAVPPLAWRGDVVQWAEWPVQLGPSRVRARVVVARMASSAVRFSLEINRASGAIAPWSIADAPGDAVIAVNAGQFTDDGPWGWVVHKQRELQPPGVGSLSGAFVIDSSGTAVLLTASEIAAWRTPMRAVEAVQSYPMLLDGSGRPPSAMCNPARGLDLSHRDARLAIGITRTGDVLIVLTRFEVLGGIATRIPIGPTTPEMVEIMRRVGADRAIMLDGGLSAQMVVRSATDRAQYAGLRDVPLALAARRR